MIRVLHVIGAMDRGGAESMIMNFYRKIDRSKYSFDFLVHEERECDFDKEIRELGGNIFRIPRYKIFNYSKYKKEVKKFFAAHHDYDIVHGHICSCINIYSSIAKSYGIKTIAHSHSANFGFSLDTIFTNVVSFHTKFIDDYFIGCSKRAGLDRYGSKIVESNRFDVLCNGIDVTKYRFDEMKRNELRAKLGIEDKLVIGHVGRFTYAKNHEFLIQVFNELQKVRPDSVLLLFGRGELEDDVKTQVQELHIENKVQFMGVVSNVYDYLNALDVFVFPSRFEGLGIVLIEAQASGLPCIINDTLTDEINLTDQVRRISLNAPKINWVNTILDAKVENRLNGYEIVNNSPYNIDKEVQHLQEIYDNLTK